MNDAERGAIAWTEARRWARDSTTIIAGGAAVVLGAGLTFLAVSVAAGGSATGSGTVQLQTDETLTAGSSSADLVSFAQSAVTMVVPLIAVVLGAQFAGSEMTSGALLHIAVAARRLRLVIAVRAASGAVVAGTVGAVTAGASIVAADLGARSAGVPDVTAVDAGGTTVIGAAVAAAVIALLTFSLACLTRRSVVVLIVVLAYVIVIEPVLAGAAGDVAAWLPRSSLTALAGTDADPVQALPSIVAALALASVAILRLRRDRAA
ncbi:hypothetical protein [Curtobacterium pusillum]|uniref:hypothetical protein n=1 Tax=Curtobacterium pusillum TaxID=69373 RepID=UPI00119C9688|nr:hypothetical protein [Curtobacterium pusillum]